MSASCPSCRNGRRPGAASIGPGAALFLLLLIASSADAASSSNHIDAVTQADVLHWAESFGNKLWDIGKQATGFVQIGKRYEEHNAKIEKIVGAQMLQEMANDVSRMMNLKIKAVQRIMEAAEEKFMTQEQHDPTIMYPYYNGKTYAVDEEEVPRPSPGGYKNMMDAIHPDDWQYMDEDHHFDDLPIVNNVSSVHVPDNVHDGDPAVMNAIVWSEELEEVFEKNYRSDPTISWQYFGSSSGILRQFPAAPWSLLEPDLYDCRMRSWYVQAAVCPKDIVIMIDISGSMTGFRIKIATHVANTLLETLSDNDFVNVFTFTNETKALVPCFENTLVQANLENIREFKNHMDHIHMHNQTNFTQALAYAFEILDKEGEFYRGANCSQAIMLITDGATENCTEVFMEYNYDKSVKVFGFLIGKEAEGAEGEDIKLMACENRGYFLHVKSLSDVRAKVMKYTPVMARPMVLNQIDHPIVWTQVYADAAQGTSLKRYWLVSFKHPQQMNRTTKGRYHGYNLMTSVATPVFDRHKHYNSKHPLWNLGAGGNRGNDSDPVDNVKEEERIADLLGVAGTDVPLKEIERLVPAYKLGVNAYSFALTNNGYILYHRDLRPVFQDILKPNYNSIDLAEVELEEKMEFPQQDSNDSLVFSLRHDMVDQVDGDVIMNVTVHYDDMRRAQMRKQKYLYRPIEGTPFSLAIVFPHRYGSQKLRAEIDLDAYQGNVSMLFDGDSWKVHPDWVYCEYLYSGGSHGKYQSPEGEVMHFLKRIQRPDWEWQTERVPDPDGDMEEFDTDTYFCDRTLLQSLVFDSMVTSDFNEDQGKDREGLLEKYGVTLSFVSTRSGLTRWHDHLSEEARGNLSRPHFFETKDRAIDEIWYQEAVEHSYGRRKDFVFTMPFDAALRNDTQVTASYAIVHSYHGFRTPVAVVGVQYHLHKFVQLFMNSTSTCKNGDDCKATCASDAILCYALDGNGFVLASEKPDNAGVFFGSVEGSIMEELVSMGVYKQLRVRDYQAVCFDLYNPNDASFLMTPINHLMWLFQWLMAKVVWLLIQTNLYVLWDPDWSCDASPKTKGPAHPIVENWPKWDREQWAEMEATLTSVHFTDELYDPLISKYGMAEESDPFEFPNTGYLNKTTTRPCDKQVDLYSADYEVLSHPVSRDVKVLSGQVTDCHSSGCDRPFLVTKVPHTSILFVMTDTYCPCETKRLSITPKEIMYDNNYTCTKMTADLYRRGPEFCIFSHPDEEEIKECSRCSRLDVSVACGLVLLAAIIMPRL